ncbi:unnamed protein product [Rhizoctonia solani]|uniref:Cyclin-like domain-containing protein n=1 Tax=Rhizoctonia solani TaxID=456999 RepID=A0A8H3A5C2_9AGAM|nr:unnamed protein product [Rhizoctonia solani]
MASFHSRQDLYDMEELPLYLNTSTSTKIRRTDSFHHPQVALDALNSHARPSVIAPLHEPVNAKVLIRTQIPPRPKPPVPSDYFVYAKRSWRSMSKEQVRMHILDRYGARQRYIAAYKEWEEKHSKWVFGIYHLVRTVTKPQRREMEMEMQAAVEPDVEIAGDTGEDAGERTTTATDVLGDLDVDSDTALTALQEGAEADELDRVKRWWTRFIEQNRPNKTENECASMQLLTQLGRQGNGTFGSGSSGSRERHGTPDVELPDQAARKMHSSVSSCVPPKLLPGQEGCSMSDDEEDDDEAEERSCPSWRIYSDQCTCRYAGCHCRTWMRWWNKTFQMLKYVDYVDFPASMSGISSTPVPGGGLLSGPSTRRVRVSVGERQELVKREPPVRSIHELKSSESNKWPWSYKELEERKVNPYPCYLKRVTGGRQENADDERASTLDARSARQGLLQMNWEDYTNPYPNIPAEYVQMSTEVMCQKTKRCLPQSAVPSPQWPSRNRALQRIASIQYTYRLPSEIFFLAVNLLDRYAAGSEQLTLLTGSQWELAGFSCLWLAWKYENHTSVPPLHDLIAYSEITLLTPDEAIRAERTIRETIGLDLSYTSPLAIIRLSLSARECSRETRYIARFLAEVSTSVRHLVCCPPCTVGLAVVWLACLLTDASPTEYAHQNIHDDSARVHEIAMYVVLGVLNMPQTVERPREQALFYKWTLPIVNNVAGWCRSIFDSVWPDWSNDDHTSLCFDTRILGLRDIGRTRPFELGLGPPATHALFED